MDQRIRGVVMAVWTGVACGSDESSADTPWCVDDVAVGHEIRTAPDACNSTRSVTPPTSEVTVSDFCVQCTPRCGATKYLFNAEEYYTDTDLPAGHCNHEGEKCDMSATAPLSECNGVTRGCAVNVYRCTCNDGKWSCVMTAQGGGVCDVCDKG
jgi:hypothetical protein